MPAAGSKCFPKSGKFTLYYDKNSWKRNVPTIVKHGALRFLVCPNRINQSFRGVGLEI